MASRKEKQLPREYKADSPRDERINPFEKRRLNLGICYLSNNETFIPHINARYIWILTEEKKIILGIEKPFSTTNIDAFEEKTRHLLTSLHEKIIKEIEEKKIEIAKESFEKHIQKIDVQLDENEITEIFNSILAKIKVDLGHPTLTSKFDDNGIPIPEKAIIAGELFFDPIKKTWILNNTSGRYFQILSDDTETIIEILKNVSYQLEEKLHIKVEPVVSEFSDKTDPKAIWNKAIKKEGQTDWTLAQHGVHLFNKIFKYNLPCGKHSSLYDSISQLITPFNEKNATLKDLIDYCRSEEYISTVDRLIKSDKDLKPYPEFINFLLDNLHEKMRIFIEFLKLKNDELSPKNISPISLFKVTANDEKFTRTDLTTEAPANTSANPADSSKINNKLSQASKSRSSRSST